MARQHFWIYSRFPHNITYPYSTCISSFLAAAVLLSAAGSYSFYHCYVYWNCQRTLRGPWCCRVVSDGVVSSCFSGFTCTYIIIYIHMFWDLKQCDGSENTTLIRDSYGGGETWDIPPKSISPPPPPKNPFSIDIIWHNYNKIHLFYKNA